MNQQQIEKEISSLQSKMDVMRNRQFESYGNGTASRAKTTTFNSNYNKLNDRLQFLKNEIKLMSKSIIEVFI